MHIRATLENPSTALRRAVIIGLMLIFLGVAIRYAFKASDDRSAFVRWRNQILDLGIGENIYDLHNYPNPPIMAIILYPFAHLPKLRFSQLDLDLGALAWFGTKFGLTVLSLIWTLRLIQEKDRPFPPWAQLLTVALSMRATIGDLNHGNVNLLILFLVVAAVYAFRCGRDFLSGLVLGLAIACKVTPALFVPYFLWKRAWRTLAGCLVGLVLFLIVVPGSVLGFSHNNRLLFTWYERMVKPYAAGAEVTTEHSNQSLPGLIYRMTTRSPSFLDEDEQPIEYHNLTEWEPWLARRVLQGCGVVFLIVMIWSCRTPLAARNYWQLAAEFSVVILGMLLFSERTWKHHCVTLLVPFAVLCYYLGAVCTKPGWRWYVIGTLVAATFLITTTSTSLWEKAFDYRIGAKLAQVYGAYVWAYLVLLVCLVGLLRTHRVRMEEDKPTIMGPVSLVYRPNLQPQESMAAAK